MNGKEARLKRLFIQHPKLLIVAVDHGEFFGAIPGAEDLRQTTQNLKEADAVLLSPGMIEHCLKNFIYPDSPTLICRLNWNSTYCFTWNYNQSITVPVLSVEDAIQAGADLVLASLALRTGKEAVDADNVAGFSRFVRQKEKLGIPLIGEFYPSDVGVMAKDEFHEVIKTGCRIIAELGADIIKTFYTGDKFAEIVERTPVPVLVLGAEKTPKEIDALRLAEAAIKAGAQGIAFGRNIIQSENPQGIIKALHDVLSGKCSSEEAVQKYNIY